MTSLIENRRNLAALLLIRVEEYLIEHDIPQTQLSEEAMGHNSFIIDMRNGSTPLLSSINRMNDFLDDNPDGFFRPKPSEVRQPISMSEFEARQRAKYDASVVVVRRDPCFLCGVRGDIGCSHQMRSEAIPLREMAR
jgi:hypothetical protein